MTRAEEEFERWRRQQRRWKRFRAHLRKAKLRYAEDYEVERIAALPNVRFVPKAEVSTPPALASDACAILIEIGI